MEVHESASHDKHVEQLMGVELREGNASVQPRHPGPPCPPKAPHSAEVHSNTEQCLTPRAAGLSKLRVKAHPSTICSKIIKFSAHTHPPFPSESSEPAGQPKIVQQKCCNSSLQRDKDPFRTLGKRLKQDT